MSSSILGSVTHFRTVGQLDGWAVGQLDGKRGKGDKVMGRPGTGDRRPRTGDRRPATGDRRPETERTGGPKICYINNTL
jgi:hypothetical protein